MKTIIHHLCNLQPLLLPPTLSLQSIRGEIRGSIFSIEKVFPIAVQFDETNSVLLVQKLHWIQNQTEHGVCLKSQYHHTNTGLMATLPISSQEWNQHQNNVGLLCKIATLRATAPRMGQLIEAWKIAAKYANLRFNTDGVLDTKLRFHWDERNVQKTREIKKKIQKVFPNWRGEKAFTEELKNARILSYNNQCLESVKETRVFNKNSPTSHEFMKIIEETSNAFSALGYDLRQGIKA